MTFRTVALVFVLAVAPFVAQPVFAQTSTSLPPSPFQGQAFAMTATAMRDAAAAVPADKTADVTVLFEETDYKFNAQHMLAFTRRVVYRVESHAGLENWSEISMDWDPWHQNPSQLHARVLQPDGSFVELDQKTVTDAPLNASESDTYTSARQRKGPLPGLGVGSIVEEVVSVDEKKPYFTAGGAYRYNFWTGVPVERERVVVEMPVSVPFTERLAFVPHLSVQKTEEAGLRRVVYEMPHQAAAVGDDIDLNSTTMPTPRVEFSTGTTWAEAAKEYAALSDPRIVTGEVEALVPAAQGGTRKERIEQLVERLHKEVRYTGVEFDESQFVPQSPAEVLKRHYGDCKDKATLLVAMLRAAKIPANLALLFAANGADIHPELPGINRFNHVIVYVPAQGKDEALWIDATAEFFRVGYLPFMDSERQALIIAPETTGLTKTPKVGAENYVLTETRTFELADIGPSKVVEVSEPQGEAEASYRSSYGSVISAKTREQLENYVKSAYLAKSLGGVDHTEGADLSKPFVLTITAEGARRGNTGLEDAAVAIFPTGTFASLPDWVKQPPTVLGDDATAEQKEKYARAVAQRSATYRIHPFTVEQRYRIRVPAGFVARPLPPDKATKLGPAMFTEQYVQESPRLVTARLKLVVDKPEMTAQEALDMQKAVAEVAKRETLLIVFAEASASLMADGKIKEALAAGREAIAQEPNSALPHVHMARALLSAGVGSMARDEAAKAVALDANSAPALMTQGWVLQHNVLGVRWGKGFDRAGAIAAYRKELPLKSEDFDPRFDLAVLYEVSPAGERYGPDASLDEAATMYRDLIETEGKKNSDQVPMYRNNLAYALLYAHKYKELDALVPQLQAGQSRNALTIVSAAAQKDGAAGLAVADKLNANPEDRNKALASAGEDLAQLGLYEQAVVVLQAGLQGQKDAAQSARQVELYRHLHRLGKQSGPIKSAEDTVRMALESMTAGTLDRQQIADLISPHAYGSKAAFEHNLDKSMQSAGMLQMLAQRSGMPEVVLRDLILSATTLKTTGDDATGYRVLAQMLGGQTENFFVVKEDGRFHIVASGEDSDEVGRYALYALDSGKPALAKSLLDWKRDMLHKGGGDDSFSGPLLPRFWTVGSTKEGADSPEAMRVAAISLLVGNGQAKAQYDSVAPMVEKASGQRQMDLELLLALGYLDVEEPAKSLEYVEKLLKEEPDSDTVLTTAAADYQQTGNFAAWKSLLDTRLAKKPADPDLLRSKMRLEQAQGNFAAARATGKQVFDTGKATEGDYNNYAWNALFERKLDAEITQAAQQANMKSNNSSFASLHTLASIYAAQGKTTEARQVLDQALQAGNMAVPNTEAWYVLGLLYESYGLKDAAIAAYSKVSAHPFDEHRYIDPTSTYLLAQQRVKALGQ